MQNISGLYHIPNSPIILLCCTYNRQNKEQQSANWRWELDRLIYKKNRFQTECKHNESSSWVLIQTP